jgi:hypothetical protein
VPGIGSSRPIRATHASFAYARPTRTPTAATVAPASVTWTKDCVSGVSLDRAVASARKRGFAVDGAEVVVHGLCARCAAEAG